MDSFALDPLVRALTYVVAIAIVLNLADDLFIDLSYFLRGLHRRSQRRLTRDELVSARQQRIAIMVPAWKEAEVIAEMLEHNLSSIDYDPARYVIFCGTYQNDPGTQACVDAVARRSASVRKVVVPHDGPTSKADCLNWVYQGIILEEETSGERFDILLMHDAEDIIHPLSLRLYNSLIPHHEFVQTPVFSLELKLDQVVAGTYIDEFAEHHLKDMLVREAISGLVPSAGVGSAFARQAFEDIACAHNQKPFNVESLTEDYEIAIKFRLAGKRVHFACRTLERPSDPDGVISAREEYVATREYFPSGFTASVRQRSRWVCGITLQTWQQVGWKGPLPVLYCLWRDRKAVFTNLVLLLAYALVLYLGAASALARVTHSGWSFRQVVPHGSVLEWLLVLNSAALLWRAALKAYFVGRLYGPVQALLSAPRLVAGNLISVLATMRALRQYAGHRLTGEPLRWLKTTHQFPNARTLRARARLLGECLIESGLLSEAELRQALSLQQSTALPLGAVLTALGLCSGKALTSALSEQWGIEQEAHVDPSAIPLLLLRALPEAQAERLDVLPLTAAGSEISVAVARQLTLAERAELEQLLSARVLPRLVSPLLLRRARERAYRRLLAPAALSPVTASRLGERLCATGQLQRAELERALEEQADSGEPLGELLHRKGLVSSEAIATQLPAFAGAATLEQGNLDLAALAKLGYAYCALHSMLPLCAAADGARGLACAFPLPESVLARVRAELPGTLELCYAPLFQLRSALSRAYRALPDQVGAELPGIAALDACELDTIRAHDVYSGDLHALWERCRSAAQAPIEHLESTGQISEAQAARLRARTYGVEEVSPASAPLTAAASLLPPSWLAREGVRIVTVGSGSALLAAHKLTPELARAVARCLPTWAIEWRVAAPTRAAGQGEERVKDTWNDHRTMN